jgi:hypothetical protein
MKEDCREKTQKAQKGEPQSFKRSDYHDTFTSFLRFLRLFVATIPHAVSRLIGEIALQC